MALLSAFIRFFIVSAIGMFTIVISCNGFAQSVGLNKSSDINFGKIIFDSSHNGTLKLGTNGSLIVSGSGLSSDYNTSAGQLGVVTDGVSTLEIRCSSSVSIRTEQSDELTVSDIEISIGNGSAFGNGHDCKGVDGGATPATIVDTATTSSPTIFVGGQVNIPSNSLPSSGNFDTSFSGESVIFDVTIQ